MVMNGSGLPGSPNKAADVEGAIFGFIENLASVAVASMIKQFWTIHPFSASNGLNNSPICRQRSKLLL